VVVVVVVCSGYLREIYLQIATILGAGAVLATMVLLILKRLYIVLIF
jgi:hypothetical protein